jgi:hypothetical protein
MLQGDFSLVRSLAEGIVVVYLNRYVIIVKRGFQNEHMFMLMEQWMNVGRRGLARGRELGPQKLGFAWGARHWHMATPSSDAAPW